MKRSKILKNYLKKLSLKMKNNQSQKNIPTGWQEVKLGKHIKLEYGFSLPDRKREAGDFPVFGSSGMVGNHKNFLVKGPGIIVGRKGTIGSVVWSEKDFCPIDTTYYVEQDENIFLRWLYYKLQFLKLNKMNTASGVPGLNREEVYKLKIFIPSKSEQEKIAEILSKVDEGIEKTEKIIDKTEKLKNGLMQELLTKGFGNTKFKKMELKNIGEIITGNTPRTLERDNYGGDYLLVSPKDIGLTKYINDAENRLSQKGYKLTRKIPKDSILVVCIGSTIGKIAIAGRELSTNQQINSVLVGNNYSNEYIYYQLLYRRSEIIDKRSTQAVPLLNKSDFSELEITIPERREDQEKIAEILSSIDEKISVNKKLREKLTQLKKGLMSDLLSGKVRTV